MGSLLPLLVLACSTAPEAPWTLSRAEQAVRRGAEVRETRWTQVRPPGGAFDRIEVHRYRGAGPALATLLYLPGTNMNGEVALDDGDHNLWLFLARSGVDVFTPRVFVAGFSRGVTAAAADPKGPSLDGKYPSVGEQLSQVLYGAWGPGRLANPVDGVSRPQVLATLLVAYDRYYPSVQDVEGRSIADRDDDPATPLDDAWGELKLPVLYFRSTGMGGDFLLDGIYTASKSGSADMTLNVLEQYGHLDVVAGERPRADVFEPTLLWITKRTKP